MNVENVIIAHPKNETQTSVLKSVMEALNIQFEEEKPYNKKFVEKIKESRMQQKSGKITRVSIDELDNFLGI